jgi:hypothetical protein
MRRWPFVAALAVVVLTATTITVYVRCRWGQEVQMLMSQPRPPVASPPVPPPLGPSETTLSVVNQTPGPCQLSVAFRDRDGDKGGWQESSEGLELGSTMSWGVGPITITSVTIERGGRKIAHELNRRLEAGVSYELRLRPDDSVDVVQVPRESVRRG